MLILEDMGLIEQTIIDKGISSISAQTIKEKILNKTIYGDYCIGRTFELIIDNECNMRGTNDKGFQDFGKCIIDFENNTLSTKWDIGWDNWTGRGYLINDEIKFFDAITGEWRTTFKQIENLNN